jgi:hypothetical protein
LPQTAIEFDYDYRENLGKRASDSSPARDAGDGDKELVIHFYSLNQTITKGEHP